jgi:MFS family permease
VLVAVLCLVQFVDVLGVTVVVTALPAMLSDLGAPASAAAPLATGYAMFFGGLLMLGARLGDRHGHRGVLLLGLAGFTAASLVAATAVSVPVLVAARCAQGAAAALSVPTALRLLTAAAPEGAPRRRALAAWSATGAAAGIAGYLVGGLLTGALGWRSVFWMNLPLAAALLLAVRARVPGRAGEPTTGLDVTGAALLTASVMALVLGAAMLEHPGRGTAGLALLAGAAVLLVVLVAVERRAATPLLPAAALGRPQLRVGVGAALVNTAATSSVVTLATLHLQQTRGLGPTAAALWLLPCSAGVVLGSVLAAPMLRRQGARTGVVVGLTIVAAGNALLLALPVAAALLPVGVAVAGTGLGLSSVATNTLGTAVPDAHQGTAAGALNTGAQLGTALGVSALLLLATVTAGTDLPLAGTPAGWAGAAGLAAAAALLVARVDVSEPDPAATAASDDRG